MTAGASNGSNEKLSIILGRIKLLLVWPALASLLVCLLMMAVAASYSWSIVSLAEIKANLAAAEIKQQSEKDLANAKEVIRKLNDKFCSSKAGKGQCVESSN